MMHAPLKNPFIVLGVSNDAEMSEIKSVGKRALMALRLDDDANPADIKRIENALEALSDPVTRFEEGLFAPELTEDEGRAFRMNPVLSTLGEHPDQDSVEAYEGICEAEDVVTQAHNQGVLRFLQAVAATEEAQKGTPDDITDDLACVELWKDAYKKLGLAFSRDQFWMRQRLRAKSYDDRRLSADRVKEIQKGVFIQLVAPVGDVIRLALLDRHARVAKAYVKLLRSSSIDAAFVEDVLSQVYKPLADRVEREVELLNQDFRNGDESGSHYKKLLKRFHENAAHDLRVMLEVGDLPGYAEEHARDTAAAFLRNLSVDAFNKADDSETSTTALKLANVIVDSQSDKERYKRDLDQIVHMEKFKPYHDRLKRYLESGNLRAAIGVAFEIIDKGGDKDGQLVALKRSLSSGLATQLHNKGVEAANNGDFIAAEIHLKEALKWETDPRGRAHIEMTTRQVRANMNRSDMNRSSVFGDSFSREPSPFTDALLRTPSFPAPAQKSGCLVAAFQLLAYVVLSGIAGGALYACSH